MENTAQTIIKTRPRSAPKYWVVKNGILYARFQYKDENGKSREKYRKIEKKSDARKTVEDLRRELENHGTEIFNADKMTFEELAAEYETVKVTDPVYSHGVKISGLKSAAQVRGYVKTLKIFFGTRKIREIKVSDLEKYRNTRLNTPVVVVKNKKVKIPEAERTGRKIYKIEKVRTERERKISGVNREMETLRAIFNFAIENDWLIKNPFSKKKGIISKAAENKRDRILSYKEEKLLLSKCTGKRSHVKPIIICALDTGMRRGEIFKMEWKDVNFETGEIYIPETNAKTETERTVGMTLRLKKELETIWEQSPKISIRLYSG